MPKGASDGAGGSGVGTVSNGTFLAWRDHASTIEGLGGWLTQTATLTGAGDPVRVAIIPTTPSLFPILQVRPLIGRLFREGEGARDQPGLVILSYGLWRERFGGRTEIVGHLVQFDDRAYTIVGVMPREFAFPDREARAWTAWHVPPVMGGGVQTGVIFRAIGRLRAGATPAQAAAEATARARNAPDMGFAARALFGAVGPIDVSAVPELQAITADVRAAILVLLAAVALFLVTSTSGRSRSDARTVFLTVIDNRSIARQIVARLAEVPKACCCKTANTWIDRPSPPRQNPQRHELVS